MDAEISSPLESVVSLKDIQLTLDSQAGPVNILRGINLDVRPGESVCITGPSGAGKTSLMMIIAGLERPTAGTVMSSGQVLNKLSEDELAQYRRVNVGIVFQSFHLIPTMTALENVAIPLELSSAADAFERAAAELELVGLRHRLTHYPSQLSGGEQQRVALARALIAQPKLILADEPTGNLDSENSARVMDLIFTLSEQKNTTLILITHQKELTIQCGRNVAMDDGRISNDSSLVTTVSVSA